MIRRHHAPRMLALAFVLIAAAACGNGADDTDVAPPPDDTDVAPPPDNVLRFTATEFAFTPDAVTADAGTWTVVLENAGTMEHVLVIPDLGFRRTTQPGASGEAEVAFQPGEYLYFCDVAGHREAGMEGFITIR